MEREEIVKELIEKVSLVYREQRKKSNETKKEMFELENTLKDKNIPYKDYMKMQDDLVYLKQKWKEELNIADGMSLAREELFE